MPEVKAGRDYVGVGTGALIINENQEFLLIRRGPKAKNDTGVWERPGGEVEFGEKIEDAVRREVREEIGVEIKIIRFLGYTDHILEEGRRHWVSFGFLSTILSGKPRNIEEGKHDAIGWFSLNSLPENITQPTREGIQEYLNETKRSK